MREGIQSFLLAAGNEGCYALCIIEIAHRITGKTFDIVAVLQEAAAKDFITFDYNKPNDENNFYVKRPDSFLSMLIDRTAQLRKIEKEDMRNFSRAKNEYVVEVWKNSKYSHFRLPDWDSLTDSNTVKTGQVSSLRVFKVL